MLPYKEIWDNILLIQEFRLPCSTKNTKDKTDLTLEDILSLKDEFILSTFEYSEKIDKIMAGHSPIIDFTFRYKEDSSIERNWHKEDLPRPLHKILNDILAVRFILPVNRENLNEVVQAFISSCPLGANKCRIFDLEKDGYHGLHLYVRFNNHVFPVEVQFWTRVDALLNQYLRDSIYTRFDEQEVITYAKLLRQWLEQIPAHLEGHGLTSYVDYLYEKAFQQQNREGT